MNRTYCFILVSFFALALCVAGCKPSGLKGLVPCSGVILDKSGQPVAEASITFVPPSLGDQSRGAAAKSDESGRFSVMTDMNDGIFPGEYKIVVSKVIPDKPLEEVRKASAEGKFLSVSYKEQMGKYASVVTSGLSATIPAKGDKNLEIKLDE